MDGLLVFVLHAKLNKFEHLFSINNMKFHFPSDFTLRKMECSCFHNTFFERSSRSLRSWRSSYFFFLHFFFRLFFWSSSFHFLFFFDRFLHSNFFNWRGRFFDRQFLILYFCWYFLIFSLLCRLFTASNKEKNTCNQNK